VRDSVFKGLRYSQFIYIWCAKLYKCYIANSFYNLLGGTTNKMKKDVIEKVAALMTAAFGLVAALAWNDAIKALFKGPCGTEGAGALCSLSAGGPWVYAIFVTILAVFAILWIAKVADKANK